MKKFALNIIVIAVGLWLGSCTETLDVKPFEYTHLLTGDNVKVWSIDHSAFTQDGEIVSNDAFASCIKDNQYAFYNNIEQSFIIKGGTAKCSAGEPEVIVSDTWSYTTSNATLLIHLDFINFDGALPYIVRKLDKSNMVLEIFLDEANTISYRFYFKATDEQ